MIEPEIVELEDGKVGYFYTPQQLEALELARQTGECVRQKVQGYSSHPLDQSVKDDGCKMTIKPSLPD